MKTYTVHVERIYTVEAENLQDAYRRADDIDTVHPERADSSDMYATDEDGEEITADADRTDDHAM